MAVVATIKEELTPTTVTFNLYVNEERMSHFSRLAHHLLKYVNAQEEIPFPPFIPLLPLSPFLGLYLTMPHTMTPDAANFAALFSRCILVPFSPSRFTSAYALPLDLLSPLRSFFFFAAVSSFPFLLLGYTRFHCADG